MVNYRSLSKKTFDSAARREMLVDFAVNSGQVSVPWRKIVSFGLALVLLTASNLVSVRPTISYFTDSATADVASFETGTLKISVDSPNIFEPKKIKKGQSSSRLVKVENSGSMDFQYKISTEIISVDSDFCEALKIKASIGNVGDEGDLIGYSTAPLLFDPHKDVWKIRATLPDTATVEAESCEFNVVVTAWQADLAEGQGFTDSVSIPSKIEYRENHGNNHSEEVTIPVIEEDHGKPDFVEEKNKPNEEQIEPETKTKPDEIQENESIIPEVQSEIPQVEESANN